MTLDQIALLEAENERLKRSVFEMSVLNELALLIGSAEDTDVLIRKIVKRVTKVVDAEQGSITLIPGDQSGTKQTLVRTWNSEQGGSPFSLTDALMGWVMHHKKTLCINDPNMDNRFPGIQWDDSVRNVLCAPMLFRSTLIGVLTVFNSLRVPPVFSPDDERLITIIGAQSAQVIESTRLLIQKERVKSLKRELEQAREIESAYDRLKKTQRKLVHSEKMAALGQLTNGIAHEIRNPLNFINNFGQILAEQAKELIGTVGEDGDGLLELMHENAQQVVKHGERAAEIIQTMMYHGSEEGGAESWVNVNNLVAEYIKAFRYNASARYPNFMVHFIQDLAPEAGEIHAAPQEIGRVMINLLSNALDFLNVKREKEPGFSPEIRVTTERTADEVKISIADNGPGIAPDHLDKIFDPFYTTRPAGQGTGLGLSLSYDIIQGKYGGSITVESEVNRGATFCILVPAGEANQS